jgi:hypothetical protein
MTVYSTHKFKHIETQEEHSQLLSIEEVDDFLRANSDYEYVSNFDPTKTSELGSPTLHSGSGLGLRKTADGFNELLKQKKNFYGPNSTINVR